MNIAEWYFSGKQGRYVPELIEEVDDKYGVKTTGPLIYKHCFIDGSYIETYGNEIVTVNGIDETGEEL